MHVVLSSLLVLLLLATYYVVFFFNDPATTEIYTLSLHDALPICSRRALTHRATAPRERIRVRGAWGASCTTRSEEHTSELQSLRHLVCRLLLEKKKKKYISNN